MHRMPCGSSFAWLRTECPPSFRPWWRSLHVSRCTRAANAGLLVSCHRMAGPDKGHRPLSPPKGIDLGLTKRQGLTKTTDCCLGPPRRQVLVRLGRKERRTAAAQGKPDVTEDETFEFMVSGVAPRSEHSRCMATW